MKDIARKVFSIEIEALQHVASLVDDGFTTIVEAILKASGKVIVTGIGKSGLIGKKIAATLSSTGTPSLFLHPGEAFHGDLGIVEHNDLILMISYSGETEELLKIIPFLKWNKNIIISFTGNPNSTIARNSHYTINTHVPREACPLALAPTSSTTAALVMGDALAIALMESRQFQPEDFARFHPGGNLGHKLLTKIKDRMRTDSLPFIHTDASFTELLLCMSEGRLGMVIVGDSNYVRGVVTDGDLRRALLKSSDVAALTIPGMMSENPVIIDGDETVNAAEGIMLSKKITTVLVGSPEQRTITGVFQIYN